MASAQAKSEQHYFFQLVLLARSARAGFPQELLSTADTVTGAKTVLIEGERGSGKSILLSKVRCLQLPRPYNSLCEQRTAVSGHMFDVYHQSRLPCKLFFSVYLQVSPGGDGLANSPLFTH